MRMAISGRDANNPFNNIVLKVDSRKSSVVHLTHNDLDAVGADAVHRIKYGDIITVFCSVGKFPHILDAISGTKGNGDILSISDLGFRKTLRTALARAVRNGWRVEWRDHHRWTEEEIQLADELCDIVHVDTKNCACGICARDLMPGDPIATEVGQVVCDYDLWKHDDPRSAVLGEVLQRKKNREYVRDCLIRGVFSDPYIEKEYSEIREDMEEVMKKSIRKARIADNKYRIAFAPLYRYPSETAARMRKELGTDIEVLVSSNGRFSIRSVPPISHILAREFNGGGHPNAAGGSFDFSVWDRLLFRFLGRSSHFSRFVEVVETTS